MSKAKTMTKIEADELRMDMRDVLPEGIKVSQGLRKGSNGGWLVVIRVNYGPGDVATELVGSRQAARRDWGFGVC